MSTDELDLSKLDAGFEFEALRDMANSLYCQCVDIADLESTRASQYEELRSIRRDMSEIHQQFELANDLPRTLRKQEELRKLQARLQRKYMNM